MTTPVENAGTSGPVENAAGGDSGSEGQHQTGTENTENASQGADSDDATLDPKVKAKIDKANREAAQLRQRVKDLEPQAAELKKLRDGEKSELTRAQEALAEREKEVQRLTIGQLRRDAALSAGLAADMVEFLSGTTQEEIEEQAKKLAKHIAKPDAPKKPADLRQGQRGTAAAGAVDKNNLIRQMAGFQPS